MIDLVLVSNVEGIGFTTASVDTVGQQYCC